MNILRKSIDGIKGLLSGMTLTLYYFMRFDKVITQQYPENRDRLIIPPRSRTRIALTQEAGTGEYNCNACGICVKACPNGSIAVDKERDPVTKKWKLTKYEYHFDRCTLCGLCVESCKSDGLHMSQQFETAVFSRDELVQILNADYRPPGDKPAAEANPAPAAPAPAQNPVPNPGTPAPNPPGNV